MVSSLGPGLKWARLAVVKVKSEPLRRDGVLARGGERHSEIARAVGRRRQRRCSGRPQFHAGAVDPGARLVDHPSGDRHLGAQQTRQYPEQPVSEENAWTPVVRRSASIAA